MSNNIRQLEYQIEYIDKKIKEKKWDIEELQYKKDHYKDEIDKILNQQWWINYYLILQ
jgi:peptidoglycan hydrolase CwlO-like protein